MSDEKAKLKPNEGDKSQKSAPLVKPTILIPFSVIIITCVTFISCLVGVLTWHFTNIAGTATSLDLASDLQQQILKTAIDKIRFHLKTGDTLTRTQAQMWRRGVYTPAGRDGVLQSLWSQLFYNKDLVTTQTFTSYTGELWGYYAYRPNASNPEAVTYLQWRSEGLNYTEYTVDANSNIVSLNYNDLNTNQSTGAWVTIVNRTNPNDSRWTNLYVWQDVIWLSNSVPIILPNNTPYGVATTDLELRFIKYILAGIAAEQKYKSSIYMFELNSGSLLGTSNPDLNLLYYDSTGTASRPLTISELAANTTNGSESAKIQAVLNFKQQSIGSQGSSEDWSQFIQKHNGTFVELPTGDLLNAKLLSYGTDINWVILMTFDKSQILSPIADATRKALSIALAITAAASIFMLVFSFVISKFLRRLAHEIEMLANFEFAKVYDGKAKLAHTSLITELFMVQTSYHKMVTKFVEYTFQRRSTITSRPSMSAGASSNLASTAPPGSAV
jgi:hypothetical protein